MGNLLLKAALEYRNKFNFSLIPFKNDKSVTYLEKWKEFQERLPTEKEIIGWWTKWPNAMIAIICGKISNLCLVDFDVYKQTVQEYLDIMMRVIPPEIPGPIANTPRGGFHRYFKLPEGEVIPCSKSNELCIDIKGRGGLAIVPPSSNGDGNSYAWHTGRSIQDTAIIPLDISIYNNIISLFNKYNKLGISNKLVIKDNTCISNIEGGVIGGETKTVLSVPQRSICFNDGSRGESLFTVINSLAKGKMPKENASQVLEMLAKSCKPEYEEHKLKAILESAYDRAKTREQTVLAEIREFVSVSKGFFSVSDCSLAFQTFPRVSIRVALKKLVDATVLERDPKRDGWFRRIEEKPPVMDIINADTTPINLKWPFGMEEFLKVLRKSTIVIAGVTDAGKSGFLLNFARLNMDKNKITYFSSEMGPPEMKERLQLFGYPIESWVEKIDFREIDDNFEHHIDPDGVNIIDYIEIYEEFYKMGAKIKNIFDKLHHGMALISIQKIDESLYGRGGATSAEKPRIYMTIDKVGQGYTSKLKIIKAKQRADLSINPNGLELIFKFDKYGANMEVVKSWYNEYLNKNHILYNVPTGKWVGLKK